MSLRDDLITAGLRSLGLLSRLQRRRGRVALGRMLGHAMMRLDARRLAITASNIERALPMLDDDHRSAVVRGSYENLGITLAELLAVPSMSASDVMNTVSFDGIELIRERAQRREPTILISGHYGNWELLAMAGALHAKTSFTIVVHPQKNHSADRLLNSYRTKFGNVVVPMREAARTLVRTLQQGGTVAFLADQHADPSKDAWIEFFGRPTPTYEAPAALALRFGAPIITGFAVRQHDGRYHTSLHALPMGDVGNDREGIHLVTARHVNALEDAVRAHPEMWSWQHRRWREEHA